MSNPAISVIVHTLNEEKNIRTCLECLKWADEIVIIDMYSDDDTVQISLEYTDKIFMHERMRYVEPARKYGLNQAKNEWVLVVDADELVPVELRDVLLKIATENRYDAVSIPRRNYFFGHYMLQTGWNALQDRQLRFFKKQYMHYTSHIHSSVQLSPQAKVYDIKDEKCSFIHFNYIDVEQFIDKLNRYTTIEAENGWDNRDEFSKGRVYRHIFREFKNRFIRDKGYKDGFQGFLLALLMCTYRASAGFKRYFMEEYNTKNVSEEIIMQYNELAKLEIKKYSK
ncbi:glycosyltransferase involved in cell wall biosynthesis [Sporomusaceae bacterium BoRhaA]|uniref:glycosyltransferase family 2 protein n=1 Tax=Pelorhabdus rhamnosifermentans TaxID=2772457 RepID=UPI001C061480|nr:glycosyltransferase family 2 protein [Pelorhabdus rhamnosifermentans]MBU2699028.1 glycosyltransferase involved in cell wall biosynthesis [Pelorhabdus rhamnosifermentans]